MFLAIILILIITGLVWLLNRVLPFKICPVCAGVSGTWLILTALILGGIIPTSDFLLPTSILMSGTVVGIAYQGEKSLKWAAKNQIVWKLIVLAFGFSAVWWVVQHLSWATFVGELAMLSVVVYLFFIRRGSTAPHAPHPNDPSNVQKIEKGLEDCC